MIRTQPALPHVLKPTEAWDAAQGEGASEEINPFSCQITYLDIKQAVLSVIIHGPSTLLVIC